MPHAVNLITQSSDEVYQVHHWRFTDSKDTRRESPDAMVNRQTSCLFLNVIMLWYGHSLPMYIKLKAWAISHVLLAGSYNLIHNNES